MLALTAVVAFASTTPPPECPSGNGHIMFLPNPDDCSSFYQCDREEPLLMQCNEGLEFNPKLKICDWPKKFVSCKRQPSTTADPSYHHTHSSTPSPATSSASPDMVPEEVTV